MATPHSSPPLLLPLFFFFFFLWLFSSQFGNAKRTSIVFATLGRSRYAFDVFSVPAPLPHTPSPLAPPVEVRLTDGLSVNYNGHFPADPSALLALLPAADGLRRPERVEGGGVVVYVSERNGSSNVYLDVPYASSGGGRRTALELEVRTRLQLPLLPTSAPISMKDRPSITGNHLIYTSTRDDPHAPRSSWNAIYSTHIPSGSTRRLTLPRVADFSPAVSPSGEWAAVASSGDRGWTGEVQELLTDIYIFKTTDGSQRARVVEHGGWPSWPDDSTLYFHRKSEDGWWSVYKVAIDAERGVVVSGVERITPPGFHAFTPAAGVGFVVFATRRPTSDYRHIELLHLESNALMEVTKGVSPESHHYNPFVSPDGARIGYHKCRGSSTDEKNNALLLERIESPINEINLFRIDGSYPSFSPDGKRIAFVGLPGLHVMKSDGSKKMKLLDGTAFSTAWDCKREGVVYTSYGPTFAEEKTEVDVISVTLPKEDDGEITVKKLSIGGDNNAFPSPSPDGKWLVFRSGRSGHKNLYIMDAVEGESKLLRRLTDGPWTDTMCNWSPNGEWIAFASDRDDPGSGSFAVYFIHPDGTGLRKVLQSGHGGRVNHPFFSPNSTHIVFTTDYAGVSAEPISNPHHYQPYGDIYTARIDGSGLTRMTHNSYEDGTPTWGPRAMEVVDAAEMDAGGSLCLFEDCQWLGQKAHSGYTASGCRAHESRG